MGEKNTLVIACATVIEEMLPLLPEGFDHMVFDFGLHTNPKQLHCALQKEIDRSSGSYETIILGYGLCSLAIHGIKSTTCKLVIPRVDDCIAIFMGSHAAYKQQFDAHPGTYYLTKGWIEVGDTPFSAYERNKEQFGTEKADLIFDLMMANYTRLALIRTSDHGMQPYIDHARTTAEQFGLAYEEINGSDVLIRKLLLGPWDEDIVIIPPGKIVNMENFIQTKP